MDNSVQGYEILKGPIQPIRALRSSGYAPAPCPRLIKINKIILLLVVAVAANAGPIPKPEPHVKSIDKDYQSVFYDDGAVEDRESNSQFDEDEEEEEEEEGEEEEIDLENDEPEDYFPLIGVSGTEGSKRRVIWRGSNSYPGFRWKPNPAPPQVPQKSYQSYSAPRRNPNQPRAPITVPLHNRARANDNKYLEGLQDLADLI